MGHLSVLSVLLEHPLANNPLIPTFILRTSHICSLVQLTLQQWSLNLVFLVLQRPPVGTIWYISLTLLYCMLALLVNHYCS